MIRAAFTAFLLSLFPAGAEAQIQPVYAANQIPAGGVQIEYRLTIENPARHLYTVAIDIRGVRDQTVSLAMPAWAPGDYVIRDFARNVQDFEARTRSGRGLEWEKTDKQTWRITKPAAEDMAVTYRVYSQDLTYALADISGPATYMYVVGRTHVPVALRVSAPRSWQFETSLERRGGAYHAPDYDIFIDAPAFAGRLRAVEFRSGGKGYRLISSDPDIEFNEDQVIYDLQSIVEAGVAVFGTAPYEDYTFFVKVLPGDAGDGLAHLNASWIPVGEDDFSSGLRYERFLTAAAQKFVQAWIGKRIRPESFGPFDYSREAYTRLLWLTEGVSNYYGRLLLLRTGIFEPRIYLETLGRSIDLLQHQPGRLRMSLEDASWNAWLRSDDSANSAISPALKGEVVGALLDLEIRSRTNNGKSLDDVMLYLMTEYAGRGVGVPEDGMLEALNAVTGSDFGAVYAALLEGSAEIDYDRYLRLAGLRVVRERAPGSLYMGVGYEEIPGGLARVTRIVPDGPAEAAGMDQGDVVIAFDDRRVTFADFLSEFQRQKLGDTMIVTLARGNDILALELRPREIREERWMIGEGVEATAEERELRAGWLSGPD